MTRTEGVVYLIPILLVSITLHELAHALLATRFGDPTPREEGRLTLNPLAHLDVLGTLTFVITWFVMGFPFGWAKPVNVQPSYFTWPKQAMALVALAGPAVNFLLALAAVAVLVHGPATDSPLIRAAGLALLTNLALGIFNLVPVPPLDGSRIVGAFMSDYTYVRWSALDQYGAFFVFGIVVIFRDEFSLALFGAFREVTAVLQAVVGG